MKKIKWLILLMIIVILGISIYLIFFNTNATKKIKNGNNMSSQEIVNYILDISSYKANVTIEIYSNKNSNKYKLNQVYISPNINKQEVIEPSNIAGLKTIRDENGLTIENSKLELSTILENYDYIGDNCLDLSCFISDYEKSNKSSIEEENGILIMKTQSKAENKYTKNKILYINKETCLPTKMEIKDTNQKTIVNILYNEVEINFNN